MNERVWFDFGSGPQLHEEDSNDKINAFIDGVQWACEQLGIDDYRQYDEENDVQPAECGNCEWSGIAGDTVQPIPDLEQRIEAGSEVPVGECPSCGALAYLAEAKGAPQQ